MRELNSGYNVSGSISHQNAYNRMNDSYQHRDEKIVKSGDTAIAGTMVADNMEMITGATAKSLVIVVHFRIGMTIHTGVMKADIIRAFIAIHIMGVAMQIDTWTRRGSRTKLTT